MSLLFFHQVEDRNFYDGLTSGLHLKCSGMRYGRQSDGKVMVRWKSRGILLLKKCNVSLEVVATPILTLLEPLDLAFSGRLNFPAVAVGQKDALLFVRLRSQHDPYIELLNAIDLA